jgi:hypothetical protein
VIDEISELLAGFAPCFSRKAAYHWFVVVVFGLIIRLDHAGVSSIIRWLGLTPDLYTTLLHFFRADSWSLVNIRECWRTIVLNRCQAMTIDGRYLFVGDGIKVSKEANKMPGVKRLHQESNNSSKPEFIFGHHFGVLGLLAGGAGKIFCVPLSAWLQEGIAVFTESDDPDSQKLNLISFMTSQAIQLVTSLNKRSLLVLDAFYAVGPCFLALKKLCDEQGAQLVDLITRAKSNCVGYLEPQPYAGKGRPRKYGQRVKLTDVFQTHREQFQTARVILYGNQEDIAFYCLDLLWKPIKSKIRFVWVVCQDRPFILMCSDLSLDPLDILTAYSYRFKVEVSFNVLKNIIGAFFYHFWTNACPKLCRKSKVQVDVPQDKRSQELITRTIHAIEAFVTIGCIATGILQILALSFPQQIWKGYRGWLRTVSSQIPSEETVRSVVQHEYFHSFRKFSNSLIYTIILAKSREDLNTTYDLAA